MTQEFKDELLTTGGLVLQGTDNDAEKATAALHQLNKLIAENDGIVGFLIDPETQKMVKTILKNPAIRKLMF